ncbi:MAG: class I SAM-dependent methyltransferase [Bacteroidota bacterium]
MNKLSLLLILVLCWACENKYPNVTRNKIESSHNYDGHGPEGHDEEDHHHHNTDHIHVNESPVEVDFSEQDLYGSADRRLWQRPDFIIRRLGDLEGKVIADIGAGPYGYFTFRIVSKTRVKKVIATDIDPDAVRYIDSIKTLMLPMDLQSKVETRLVQAKDSRLEFGEADVVLMVNTYTFIDDPIGYLRELHGKMAPGGKLYIIDFKKRRLSIGPEVAEKKALYIVEQELEQAGFTNILSDDQSLEFQYIVEANRGLDN